ncbi:serine hydroxymethyltransferase 7-like protein isoform X2, partial [Tanacetum coccineum]
LKKSGKGKRPGKGAFTNFAEILEERVMNFRQKILICNGSSYLRDWDYGKFIQIADECSTVLMCNMAQISGLIATKTDIDLMKNLGMDCILIERKCVVMNKMLGIAPSSELRTLVPMISFCCYCGDVAVFMTGLAVEVKGPSVSTILMKLFVPQKIQP